MAQYSSFWQAYLAAHPDSPYTPAGQTWTPQNLQNLSTAYVGQGNAPTQQMISGGYAPKPPVFDPMLDPSYAAAYSSGQTAQQHAQAERDYQYGAGAQQYGINAQGGFDPANPYSQAAILKRNYDAAVRGTNNSYAANGQLYAGSRINAQNANDFNYGANSDQLKRAAQSFYHAQDQNVQGVGDQVTANLAALLGPALANFLATQRGS